MAIHERTASSVKNEERKGSHGSRRGKVIFSRSWGWGLAPLSRKQHNGKEGKEAYPGKAERRTRPLPMSCPGGGEKNVTTPATRRADVSCEQSEKKKEKEIVD